MVEAGVGVGVVPQTTARRAARTMRLAVIDLADDWACGSSPSSCAPAELRPYARELVDALRA
ncbi:MAG: hypothetical protein KIS90_07145 [Phenylobacterium sp.]|nr:hypothetical protein [Phenylobacterium sp.]